jgi:hypothetical protein
MDKATTTPAAKPAAIAAAAPPTVPADTPEAARTGFGTIMLAVALLGMLAGAAWYASRAWTSLEGPPMPAVGYVAMTLGVVFSLLVGFALMALVFYSSRRGYDERAAREQPADPAKTDPD